MTTLEELQCGWNKRPGARFLTCPITGVQDMQNGKLKIKTLCPICNTEREFMASTEGAANWLIGDILIQDAFPELNLNDRESLVNGVCCL